MLALSALVTGVGSALGGAPRSRLLLDRDLATKNTGLAELYEQLGFGAWGAFEAQNSLEADFTNASAHIFMANSYGELPDRLQASGSELLQYFLYAPVNRNLFNNSSEYTALLERALADGVKVVSFMLPASAGGSLEVVRQVVDDSIANMRLMGVDVAKASAAFAKGDAALALGDFRTAYSWFMNAYQQLLK